MSGFRARTDLAVEARQILKEAETEDLPGIDYYEGSISDITYQIMTVSSPETSERLGKPVGRYCTVEIDPVMRRERDAFNRGVDVLSSLLRDFFPEDFDEAPVLVAGLGNRAITPDSVGPLVLESTLVTRHLKRSMPEDFSGFREVAAVSPGVLGTSGIESSDFVKYISEYARPSFIVAVDALAAKDLSRLCRTIQITDTGITPGSGVGNSRAALNREVMGVPVIALGVPTVVDLRTICDGIDLSGDSSLENQMIVTPRNIDSDVVCISRLIGFALNLALHEGLTIADIDMLLG